MTGRTRTGFFRGHVPACRPLLLRPQSTREESNLRHPLCERGGLATDLLVANCTSGIVQSNHVVPRYQRGAVSVWLIPLELVVPAVLEPAPAGLQPAAPPSELQDVCTRPGTPRPEDTPLSGIRGRRRGSNPLFLGYDASVLTLRTSPAGWSRPRWARGARAVAARERVERSSSG